METAKYKKEYVGDSLDDFLNENYSEEQLNILKAKADFLIELQELRKQTNMTQKELAEKIGVTQATIAKMEKGLISISLKNLFKILGAMGKTIQITSLKY